MLAETIQLETLRQKIEDAEYEAGNQSDYLDRGKPNAKQAKQAQELIEKLNNQSKALKAELRQLIATVRSQQPQAFDEWVNFHIGILQQIADEKEPGVKVSTRQFVAKSTLQEWEKVRAGEQDYVGINWHYLKDYKASVRKFESPRAKNSKNKSWWQFWK
ncbi:MAG TPA: hypothetical protein VK897_00345 [Anaerolineales bacterium]|nr:hypothetical protein [Anaerolineales bacterium]